MSWVYGRRGKEEGQEEEGKGGGGGRGGRGEKGGGGKQQLAHYNPTHPALVDIQFVFSIIRSGRAAKMGKVWNTNHMNDARWI